MTPTFKTFLRLLNSSSAKKEKPTVFFPDTAKNFMRNRALECCGTILILCALSITIAIVSYSETDSSLNTSSDLVAKNFLGTFGAVISDLLLQTIGFACFVPILTLFIWGIRICKKKPLNNLIYRSLGLISASLFYSVALTPLPVTLNWPLMTSMGGAFGAIIIEVIATSQKNLITNLSSEGFSIIAGGVGVFIWLLTLGVSKKEWQLFIVSLIKWLTFFMRLQKTFFSLICRKRGNLLKIIQMLIFKTETNNRNTNGKKSNRIKIEPNISPDTKTALIEKKHEKPKLGAKSKLKSQGILNLGDNVYSLPSIELLTPPPHNQVKENLTQDALEQNARFLSSVLQDFGIKGEIVKVHPGPVVTLYELEPAPGTKTSRVIGLSDDIARSMSAVSVRVAVVSGRNVIGIELPNISRETVYLRELLGSVDFEKSGAKLPLALGKNINGAPIMADLSRMPHLLIAGTTGSGKSVAMNTMILSLLYHCSPDECKFIMIDPKMLELSVYEGIPHLLTPVVTEPSKAIIALKWTVREMEDRYRIMSHLGVRNIAGYNMRLAEALKSGTPLTRRVQTGFAENGNPLFEEQPLPKNPFPFIVVVVDEMADLMLVAGKDVEATIQRLAQMARAAGIHLIMATQRPSVDVITGTIKANFPTRISFQVTSKIDSRTILGEQGAEQLLGQGDMLHMAGGGRISRVHGPFVSDKEVEEIVAYLKNQGQPNYIEAVTFNEESDLANPNNKPSEDALYDEAVALISREGKASTSFIQRHLQIGYNRAARIIETMEKEGVVSPASRVGKREVLIGHH